MSRRNNARDNRKARRKRDRRLLERLAHKRMARSVLRHFSVSPDYYDVVFTRITTRVVAGHRRVFDTRKTKVRVRPNARYFALLATLARMAGGLMVTIPRGAERGQSPG